MSMQMSYPGHVKAILTLGLPLIGGHLAQFAVGLTDTVMLGWYGVGALAAVTLAGSFYFLFFMLGSGFAFAVMPLVAAASAAGDEIGLRRATRMGLWLSVGFAVLAMPVMLWSRPILIAIGQEPEIATEAAGYLRIAGWSLFPALLAMVLKSYLAALERTQVVFWVTLGGAFVNGAANYALIFGNWGAPEMGVTGAALASVSTQVVTVLAVALYARAALPEHGIFVRLWRADWEMLRRVFALGLPIGFTTLAEVSLFAASAFMMGWLGEVPLAAHGIVITVASGAFMIHLGLGNVATIRAGNALGRSDRAHMARGAGVVTGLSLIVAILTSVAFLLVPEAIISLFLDADDPARPRILEIGVVLLAVAALFQLVDGAQAIALGLLRGVQDTRVPLVMAALSYWAVGMPMSYVLGFVLGWGSVGVWLGLVGGLACAGVFLMWRFWRGALARVPLLS